MSYTSWHSLQCITFIAPINFIAEKTICSIGRQRNHAHSYMMVETLQEIIMV